MQISHNEQKSAFNNYLVQNVNGVRLGKSSLKVKGTWVLALLSTNSVTREPKGCLLIYHEEER